MDLVNLLLKAGADPKVKDRYGFTPLYIAADQGHESCVQVLIDAGSDMILKTSVGYVLRIEPHGTIRRIC